MERWHKRGELNGLPIWESDEGHLAIERDFELLCELTPEERAQWQAQQETTSTRPSPAPPQRLPLRLLRGMRALRPDR